MKIIFNYIYIQLGMCTLMVVQQLAESVNVTEAIVKSKLRVCPSHFFPRLLEATKLQLDLHHDPMSHTHCLVICLRLNVNKKD